MTDMSDIDLYRVDLNLLVVLDALLETRSVTDAARKLGRSQSAVSHSLGRLREQLGDPLLVRVGQRMETTPHAETLRAPLGQILERVSALITPPPDFDPATAKRQFTFYVSDYAGLTVLPRLYARIRKEAPGVDLNVLRIDSEWPRKLEDGIGDLAITPEQPDHEARYRMQVVFSDQFITLAPPGTVTDGQVPLNIFLTRPHVLVSPEGRPGSTVQAALAPLGLSRRIGLNMPYFLGAVEAASASDTFITMPQRLAPFLCCGRLEEVEPPMYMVPFYMRQVWHVRTDSDPAAQWLRSLIHDVGRSLPAGPEVPAGVRAITPP